MSIARDKERGRIEGYLSMPPSPNTRGLACIVKADQAGATEKHIGTAFVVDSRHLMTCCHVVNEALDRKDRFEKVKPPADIDFAIRFPFADNATATGKVVRWGFTLPRPVDVAVIELDRDVPSAAGVAVFRDVDARGERWSCVGWNEGGVEHETQGEIASLLSRNERQLNGPTGLAARIGGGYSGAPVWAEASKAFVGMVVTVDREQHETGIAYAIPTNVLAEVWPELPLASDGRLPTVVQIGPQRSVLRGHAREARIPPTTLSPVAGGTVGSDDALHLERPSGDVAAYIFYLARDRVSTLFEQVDEVTLAAAADRHRLLLSFAEPTALVPDDRARRAAVGQLAAVLQHLEKEAKIADLGVLVRDRGQLDADWYRVQAEFTAPWDPFPPTVNLTARLGDYKLVLTCSKQNFAGIIKEDGKYLPTSTGAILFDGQSALPLRGLVRLVNLDREAKVLRGSALFLVLDSLRGSL